MSVVIVLGVFFLKMCPWLRPEPLQWLEPEPLHVLPEARELTTGGHVGPGPRRGQTLTDPEKGPVSDSPFHLHFYPFTWHSVDNSNIRKR